MTAETRSTGTHGAPIVVWKQNRAARVAGRIVYGLGLVMTLALLLRLPDRGAIWGIVLIPACVFFFLVPTMTGAKKIAISLNSSRSFDGFSITEFRNGIAMHTIPLSEVSRVWVGIGIWNPPHVNITLAKDGSKTQYSWIGLKKATQDDFVDLARRIRDEQKKLHSSLTPS